MEKILGVTIGVLAVIGVGIGFMSDSSTESTEPPVYSKAVTGSDQQNGGKRSKGPKKAKSRRKRH